MSKSKGKTKSNSNSIPTKSANSPQKQNKSVETKPQANAENIVKYKVIALIANIIMLTIGIYQFIYEYKVIQGNVTKDVIQVKIITIIFIITLIIENIFSRLLIDQLENKEIKEK
jgi:ABC-type protease/lipase transport system fused ATPase/permease subunit